MMDNFFPWNVQLNIFKKNWKYFLVTDQKNLQNYNGFKFSALQRRDEL